MGYFMDILFFPAILRTVKERFIVAILILLFSGWISYTIFSISLNSEWSIVDDKEIAYFLGSDKKINISEAWEIYTQDTEIGKYGLYGRFRPAYYAFRLLESLIWNDELIFWYLTNIFIFSLFIAVFWYLSAEFVGLTLSGLITFYMATALYWRDVFGRLGPSEPYVVFGMCMAAIGIYMMYKFKINRFGWLFVNIGLMICTGSKENTILFLILYALILFDQYRTRGLHFSECFLLFLTVVWNGWIFSAILIAVAKTGRDVYQSSILHKLLSISNVFFRSDVILLCLVAVFFLGAAFYFRRHSILLSKSALLRAGVVIFLLAFYISQCFYYTGDFPNDDRYDVPGLLVGPIVLILILSIFQLIIREWGNRNYEYIFLAVLITVGAAIDVKRSDNIQIVHKEIKKYLRSEERFTRDLEELAALAGRLQDYDIVFQVSRPVDDYEIILSYDHFLRYYGVHNPIAVYWSGDTPPKDDYLYPYYADLAAISDGGSGVLSSSPLGGDFVPLLSLISTNDQKCIIVLFSQIAPERDCSVMFQTASKTWAH